MSCDDPIREDLRAFAAGELDGPATGRVLEHLETCADCTLELETLADLLVALELEAANERRGPVAQPALRASPARTRWVAAAAAVLVLSLVLFELASPPALLDPGSLADLRAPAYAAAARRDSSGDSLATDFERAMEPYGRSDWSAAARTLDGFLVEHPEHRPARFYRAAVQAAAGSLGEAAESYGAVALEHDDYLAEHALWRRANVLLADGRSAAARSTLRELAGLEGPFAPSARALLERLGPASGGAGPAGEAR